MVNAHNDTQFCGRRRRRILCLASPLFYCRDAAAHGAVYHADNQKLFLFIRCRVTLSRNVVALLVVVNSCSRHRRNSNLAIAHCPVLYFVVLRYSPGTSLSSQAVHGSDKRDSEVSRMRQQEATSSLDASLLCLLPSLTFINREYSEDINNAVQKCKDDARGQKCYICNLTTKTHRFPYVGLVRYEGNSEGLVRMCACHAEGFVHITCLVERANILTESTWENYQILQQPMKFWTHCSLCKELYRDHVLSALSWARFGKHRNLRPIPNHLLTVDVAPGGLQKVFFSGKSMGAASRLLPISPREIIEEFPRHWQPASSGVFYWEERLPRVFAHQLRSGVTHRLCNHLGETNNDQLILKLYVSWFYATFQLIESMVVYDINYYDIKLYILNSLVESFHHFVTIYVTNDTLQRRTDFFIHQAKQLITDMTKNLTMDMTWEVYKFYASQSHRQYTLATSIYNTTYWIYIYEYCPFCMSKPFALSKFIACYHKITESLSPALKRRLLIDSPFRHIPIANLLEPAPEQFTRGHSIEIKIIRRMLFWSRHMKKTAYKRWVALKIYLRYDAEAEMITNMCTKLLKYRAQVGPDTYAHMVFLVHLDNFWSRHMKKTAYKRWVVIKNLMKNLMKKKKDALPDMVCAVFTPVDGDRDNLRAIVKHMSARMQDMGYNVSKVERLSAQPSTPSTAQSTPADGDRLSS